MFLPEENPKQKTAIMFDPQQEREAKRKRALAELLIQKGNTPLKNEQAGGMTVKRSPWENINQAAQNYMGQHQLEGADNQIAEAEKRRQEMIREALSSPDQMQAAQVLAQDPNTSDAAIKMYSDLLSDQRRAEQMKEIAQVRGSFGGNTPAAIQIANDIQDAIARGDYDRANMLYEIGKYQDKGIQRFGVPQGGFMPPEQGQQMQTPMDAAPRFGPQQGGLDPLDEHAQAVMMREQQMGVNPMQRPQMQPQPIQGYADALGQIKGTVKESEAIGQARGKYMEEGRQSLPKIQRSLQSAELRAENISRVASQTAQTAQRAFTTGFTGSIIGAVAGTPAYDLKNNLQTLEAVAAFDTLQNMRDNSPTGGALGQVTERELDLLKAAYSNLSNSQSYEQFIQNLDAFNRQNQASLQNARAAYEQDYQRFGGQSDQYLPPPTSMQAQQPAQHGRDEIINRLRQGGIPEERIMQYLQAKGM